MKSFDFILASASPRRIEIMKNNGFSPMVIPADIEENLPAIGGMKETAMFLALKKAKAVESCLDHDCLDSRCHLIIAADTIVYKDEIMGKPLDAEDAFRMLSALRGTYHHVVTGVALVEAGAQNSRVFAEVTKVFFKDYSDEELRQYLSTDEAYDKAGAYAIQGYFSRYIERIEGDYDNVVGFPWKRIESELKLL